MTSLAQEFQSNPYVDTGALFINGLTLAYATATTLTVKAGSCRDSTNSYSMTTAADLTLNTAVKGANGLDTGTLAASTLYWVFSIGDLQQFNAPATLLSLSSTTPTMPSGYSLIRRIGRILTDGSSHILSFTSSGQSNTKFIQFATPVSVLAGGSSATFAAVNLLLGMPGGSVTYATPVYLNAIYTPALAANTASIRPTGSAATATNCPVELKSNVNAVAVKYTMTKVLPGISSGNLSIDYAVTASDALSLSVAAYEESL